MGLRIATNLASMSANRLLTRSSEDKSKVYQRLASGNRITHAGDDAAGLSISENLRAQIRSMDQAVRNANDGISFSQVAEGGLTEIGNIMIRLRELGIQAASDTVGDRERGFINEEVRSLTEEIDRISIVTNFNGTPLLNGQAKKGTLEFQVGIQATEADRIVFDANRFDVRSEALGIDGLDYESIDGAREALDKIDEGMNRLYANRATLGAAQSKLQSTVRNLEVSRENLWTARSRIADADIAKESSDLVRFNILESAGISVLSQANVAPMSALRLLS